MEDSLKDFKNIVENPVEAYTALQDRLIKLGANAPFPEFKPVIDFLHKEMASDSYVHVLEKHPDLELEHKEVVTLLAHINLQFDFDDEEAYPYGRPFEAPYPYRPTIDAIESALRFLDKLSRLAPGSKAVPLYHFDRYAYHRHSLLADTTVVIMPTLESITYADFIRTRAVPIGFIGVIGDVIRVDRHQQSPLDFWYHDLNHVRRMAGYLKQSELRHGATSNEARIKLHKSMDDFILNTLMPAIEDLPAAASEEDRAVRRLVRVILFEILHETALTPEKESILSDILRPAIPQPFEHMVSTELRPVTAEETERLRTPTGNLQSGISTIQDEGSTITVRYFHDRALALLANVYNKLNFGFYDDPGSPSEFVTPVKFRTPEHMLKAVHEIFRILGYNEGPSDDYLLSLITSREGSAEKFVYQGVVESEATELPYATEPLPAETIINDIRELGKTVITLFGFSYLGYEDPNGLLAQVKQRLSKYDPRTTIINIGATEEGIGAAYKVAKEFGFKTIGVVSTLALTYSGRFSDYVDNIYIVNDEKWGGYVPGTTKVADTTRVYLAVSDEIHAFGGGDNTAIILKEAQKAGTPISYTPAEMNHKIADSDTSPHPGYNGSAYAAWKTIADE